MSTSSTESYYDNNSRLTYIYPDYSLILTSGNGGKVDGNGSYTRGDTVVITAIPDSGYIFEGWYENGKKLYGATSKYEIEMNSNRTIEAKFKPNDLKINDIEVFGSMKQNDIITFTAEVTGGTQPYQWEFDIYKDGKLLYSNFDTNIDFFEWTPENAGEYDIILNVTDKSGYQISYSKQFTVT